MGVIQGDTRSLGYSSYGSEGGIRTCYKPKLLNPKPRNPEPLNLSSLKSLNPTP